MLAEENTRQNQPTALTAGHTLGQTFTTERTLHAVSGRFPTWSSAHSGLTLTLRRDGAQGPVVATQRFASVRDNEWLQLQLATPLPPGAYCLEASDATGQIG